MTFSRPATVGHLGFVTSLCYLVLLKRCLPRRTSQSHMLSAGHLSLMLLANVVTHRRLKLCLYCIASVLLHLPCCIRCYATASYRRTGVSRDWKLRSVKCFCLIHELWVTTALEYNQ